MFRADNLAFLNGHGEPPVVNPEIGLELVHVTAAPPFFLSTEQVLHGAEAPNGRHIPGVKGYRSFLEQQGISIVEIGANLQDENTESLQVILGVQGSPHDADNANMQQLHDAGLRIMGIGYESADHPYGAGFSDNHMHLTTAGQAYIEQLASNGMVLDLSHCGHQTALDSLEYARDHHPELPIYASHSGVLDVSGGHNRNFPAEVLYGIKERGGIVGIYALTFALHESDNSLQPMLEHINRAVALLGVETVAIGSDGIYQTYTESERQAQFANMGRMLDPKLFSARYPSEPDKLNTPSKMDVIADSLTNEGYSEEQIAGIIGLNSLRFYGASIK